VCATPGALAEIGVSGDDLSAYLPPSVGDWGDIDAHDRKENQLSLEQGFRLMSLTGGGGASPREWHSRAARTVGVLHFLGLNRPRTWERSHEI